MKKFFMMMAAAACMFAAACDKEDGADNNQKPGGDEQQEEPEYLLTSTPLEGSKFEAFTDTEMRFVYAPGYGTAVLKMNRVKFAEKMPPLDIEVPGVPVGDDGRFAADAIVPTFVGEPMPAYTMTGFVLTLDQEKNIMTVEFDCFTMHVEYRGACDIEM